MERAARGNRNEDHDDGRRDPLGRNVATEIDTTKAEEISHKDQVRGLDYPTWHLSE